MSDIVERLRERRFRLRRGVGFYTEHDADVDDQAADEIVRLRAEVEEARRRRDQWMAKAEGYDAVRLALREKVGAPWPPNLSRAMWAGIAADEKKRADDAEVERDRLRDALRYALDIAKTSVGPGYDAIAEKARAALGDTQRETTKGPRQPEG